MKVLRVLGLIFGILLLLTGGGLLAVSAVADRGQSAVQQQIEDQGLKGPVTGTVLSADPPTYTVEFTAGNGRQYTATAGSTLSTPPRVGDTVQIYYQADDPSVAAITDLPTTALGEAAGTLRVAGFITLVVGGVLLIAAIFGFVLVKKAPTAATAQTYPTATYPTAGSAPVAQQGGYPTQGDIYWPDGAGHPVQPRSPYPPQQGGYPTPPSPYPPQPPADHRSQQ